MEEGWVVVWAPMSGEGLCKAQEPIRALPEPPPPHHHPRPFLHRGGRGFWDYFAAGSAAAATGVRSTITASGFRCAAFQSMALRTRQPTEG